MAVMKVPKSKKKFITIMRVMTVCIIVWLLVWIAATVLYASVIPAIAGAITSCLFAIILAEFYYSGVQFVCPDCNIGFVPKRADLMKNVHVKRGRKFTCPSCGKEVVAIESFRGDIDD